MADARPWPWIQARLYSLIARDPRSNRLAVDLCDLNSDSRFLDIGCGPGAAVRAAGRVAAGATGLDNSLAMIDIARSRAREFPNVEFVHGSAESLPLPDAAFTHAVTVHAFHHWDNQQAGITEALRVLRPQGTLLIIERATRGRHGLTEMKARALADRLQASGFAEAEVSTHDKEIAVRGGR